MVYRFVPIPREQGRWFRCHQAVMVTCPSCGVVSDEPCKGPKGYLASLHKKRIDRWHELGHSKTKPPTGHPEIVKDLQDLIELFDHEAQWTPPAHAALKKCSAAMKKIARKWKNRKADV